MVEDGKFIESSFCVVSGSDLTALLFIIAFLLVNMADFGSWIIFVAVLTVSLVLGSTTL